MRKEYEFEVGDLVHVGHTLVGTVIKKSVEHVSSAGPRHDVVYDVLIPEVGSVLHVSGAVLVYAAPAAGGARMRDKEDHPGKEEPRSNSFSKIKAGDLVMPVTEEERLWGKGIVTQPEIAQWPTAHLVFWFFHGREIAIEEEILLRGFEIIRSEPVGDAPQ